MAGFLLDTNVLSEFKTARRSRPRVAAWLRATDPDLLWASVLSFGEIRKGIERLAVGKRRSELEHWLNHDLDEWFKERILPITRSIAERWGVLNAKALDRGRPLPSVDGLFAATALEHHLIVVTRNVTDFAELGVELSNPWDAA